MSACPKCHAQLSSDDLRAGRCGACHATIAPTPKSGAFDSGATIDVIEPTAATVPIAPKPAANDDQTWQAAPLAPELPGTDTDAATNLHTIELGDAVPPNSTPTVQRADQTIDLDALAKLDRGAAPSAGTDVALLTIDSAGMPAELAARMSAAWPKLPTSESPGMTIKSIAFEGEDGGSSIVIQQRGLARSDGHAAPTSDYDLLDVIGEGGVGVVYAARQASIDRQVAVKMLKPATIDDPAQQRKFLSEAVVTGELEHPGIIPIYDLGCNRDGTLFYSMKRVQGTPWSKVLRKRTLAENLEILLRVCDAVSFAHAKGVVHRDLKPENIMLGDFGEVLVLDWGLALSLNHDSKATLINRISALGGTPAYMAPEMAMGPIDAIGVHSDVYLLGAILFECVTGLVPHQGKTATACLVAAAQNVIRSTEKQNDLTDIALRAMATAPRDRYASVREFQLAIRECQSHFESITLVERADEELRKARLENDYQVYARALFGYEEAHQLWDSNQRAVNGIGECRLAYATAAYGKGDFDLGMSLLRGDDPRHATLRGQIAAAQLERDARRQRLRRAKQMMAALAALVFVSVTTGIVLVSIQKAEADRQRGLAEASERVAQREKAEAIKQRGIAVEQRSEADKQREIAVDERSKSEYQAYVAQIGLAAARTEENAFGPALELLDQCKPELRHWEWGRLKYLCQQEVQRFDAAARIESVAFDAAGEHIAAAARDGHVRIWEVATGKLLADHELNVDAPDAMATSVGFSPVDAEWLAIGGSKRSEVLRLWNFRTGETKLLPGHDDTVVSVAFTRDGKKLLSASMDNRAMLWDVDTGQPLQTFRGHEWWVWDAAFSPDETQVVTASQDGTVRLWDAATGQERMSDGQPMPFTGHRGAVYTARFAPDGQSIASAGYDQRVLLWKPAELSPFNYARLLQGAAPELQPAIAMEGHQSAVRALDFSADGEWLLSASHDNTLKVWSARDGDSDTQFVPAGTLLKTLRGHSGQVRGAAFSPRDRNVVASGGYDHQVRLWNVAQYAEDRTIPGQFLRGHGDAVLAASFAPQGDFVVTASRDRTAKTWNVETGAEVRSFREGHLYLASSGLFFPDGEQVATAAIDGSVSIWNIATGVETLKLSGTGSAALLALSADGRWLITGRDIAESSASDADPREPLSWTLWDATNGQALRSLGGHAAEVTTAAFSPDGRFIFTGDARGRGNLWNAETGELLHTMRWHTDRITAARFLAARPELVTASSDRTVCRWDLTNPAAPRPLEDRVLKHSSSVTSMAITSDGLRLISGCEDGLVRGWELLTATPLWERALPAGGLPRSVDASADDQWLAVVDSTHDALHVWSLENPSAAAELTLELSQEGASVWSATFAPDARSLLTVGGNEARVWDLQGVERMNFRPHRTVSFASYSPDGARIVTSGWDHSARIWDASTGAALRKLAGTSAGAKGGHSASVNSAVFSPQDGKHIVTASDDGVIKIWDAESGVALKTLRGHSAAVQHAAYSPDGRFIVSSSRDKTARVWDAATGESLVTLTGHELSVLHAAFSHDGQFIATASEDTTVKLWNAATGQELRTLTGHTAPVICVAFAPDGARLLSGSGDHTAKLWDAQLGTEILSLKGHQQDVTSVAFSADGQTTLTASRDGTAILWPAAKWQLPSDEPSLSSTDR
jgi:WD40 repeat protein/tRNA A-37 threonylcarbamoyl transferase component Bud32